MMSNVYGYCNAGCRRRVPTYDEFKKIAAYVRVNPEEVAEGTQVKYNYHLTVGETYRIRTYNPPSVDLFPWGVAVTPFYTKADGTTAQSNPLDLGDYDEYADGLRLKLLAIVQKDDGYYLGYECNGVRYERLISSTVSVDFDIVATAYTDSTVIDGIEYWDKLDVVMYNEDVEICGKSAYEIACEHGFEGTEEEWVASLSNSLRMFSHRYTIELNDYQNCPYTTIEFILYATTPYSLEDRSDFLVKLQDALYKPFIVYIEDSMEGSRTGMTVGILNDGTFSVRYEKMVSAESGVFTTKNYRVTAQQILEV